MKNPILNIRLIIALVFLGNVAFSQNQMLLSRKIIFEATFGNRFNNQMTRAVNAFDGGSLCVGVTESPSSGGSDGLLMKFDRQGKKLFQISFDNGGTDQAMAVCEGPFNRIIIGGNSASGEKSGKSKKWSSAWLICRDTHGEPIWQVKVDSSISSETVLKDVVWVEDLHEFHCVGTNNGWLWWASVSEAGSLLNFEKYDKAFPQKISTIRMRWLNGADYLYGAGVLSDKLQIPFFAKISATGAFVKQVSFPDHNVALTANFIPLQRGGRFIGTGSVKVGLDRGDVFLFKFDTSMVKENCIFYKNFPAHGYDEGIDLIQVRPNVFYVTGSSSSYGAGARTTNFAAWLLKGDGTMADSDGWFFGTPLEERSCQLLQKSDGSLWLFGTSDIGSQMNANDEFYVANLQKGPENDAQTMGMSGAWPIKLDEKGFSTKAGGQILHSNERGYLVFSLKNESNETCEGLWATARCADCPEGIFLPDTLQIQPIEMGAVRQFSIPIIAGKLTQGGKNKVEISFYNGIGKQVRTLTSQFEYEKEKAVDFVVTESKFVCQGDSKIQKGRLVKFCFEIENSGNLDARDLKLTFQVPNGVNYQGDYAFLTPFLNQKGRKKYEVVLLPENSMVGNELMIDAFLTANGADSVFKWSFKTTIADEELKPAEIVSDKIEQPSTGGNVEIRVPKDKNAGDGSFNIAIGWADGSSASDQQVTILNDSFEVKVIAFSVIKLKMGDFTIIVNGDRKNLQGNKFEEEPLKLVGRNQYRFTYKVPVSIGKNNVSVEVKTESGLAETEPLNIISKGMNKGTLYVLSIGVPDKTLSGLKYTQKDAQDFAALFQKQQGKLFGEVNIKALTKPEETTTLAILKELANFKTMNDRRLLTKNDAIVIFISSHGFEGDDGSFMLRASDYDGVIKDETSISYENKIVAKLGTLPCKKFIFLDACHSGALYAENSTGRKGEAFSYGEAMVNLVNADNSMRAMTSCGVQEYSYEDDRWQNGAFTKVIKDVFSDAALCKQLDQGVKGISRPDGALSLAEIYTYVQKEVNRLVKKDRSESQTPFISTKELEEDVPFFSY